MRITDFSGRPIIHADHMEIVIRLDELAPPVGEAGETGGESRPFAGWLGLLALLGQLLQPQPPAELPGGLTAQLHPGPEPDLGEDV